MVGLAGFEPTERLAGKSGGGVDEFTGGKR